MEEERRKTSGWRTGYGVLVARFFWLTVVCGGSFWAYERWERGEWPWDIGSRRLDGVTLLARSSWGAGRAEGSPTRMSHPERITIHHVGGKVVQDLDRDATARSIKAIQVDHIRSRGWNDIGYHYIVDRSGRVWEGRLATQTGAHAGSAAANERNIGVLLLGNFDLQTPSEPQLTSCGRLVEALRKRHGISRESVLSHNEVRSGGGLGPTSCPGKHLASWVERYRRGEVETVQPTPGAPAPGDNGIKLVKS